MSRRSDAVRASLLSLAVWVGLAFAQPAAGDDEYPATAYFLDGLTEESRWSEILAKPGMKADFPYFAFETTLAALDSVCVDGPMLAIANSRLDTGVRTSAEPLRAQVEAAASGRDIPTPAVQLAASVPGGPARQVTL